MKIVINDKFGGFSLPDGFIEEHNLSWAEIEDYEWGDYYPGYKKRACPKLVQYLEEHPNECGSLVIIEIPDETTDWTVSDYDGLETLHYVVDGKLYKGIIK